MSDLAMSDTPRWRWRNLPLPEPHLGLIASGLILRRVRPWMLLSEPRLRLLAG